MARSTLEVNDLLDFVTQIPALKVYSSHLRRSLCEQATLVHFEQGQRVCTQGDYADAFYVILTGAVQVYKEAEGKAILGSGLADVPSCQSGADGCS